MARVKLDHPPRDDLEAARSACTAPTFSAFTINQRRWIIAIAAFAGMFSPMSSFIFYPAITSIADDLGVTVELVNLAITTYMIVSGLVPALLGNAADKFGRRPVYLLALTLYLAANLGLSLQRTYAGLLILRMLQSAGSSSTVSLGYGVIADITTRAERGFYVGILLLGLNVSPSVGPVLGGALAAKLGWKWIFWFLCILGGACLLIVFIALPETSRVIVANGTRPARGIYRSLLPGLVEPASRDKRAANDASELEHSKLKTSGLNPLDCVKLLLERDIAAVIMCHGIYYTIFCCVQASLSTLFVEVYGYGSLESGLIYLPFGIACLVSTLIWGKVLDYDYTRTGQKYSTPIAPGSYGGDEDFPIEEARLRSVFYLMFICTAGFIANGWAIQHKVHVAVPLTFQAFIGFAGSGVFVTLSTLITDLNQDRSSTAAASSNFVRCAMAAPALAVLQMVINEIGIGWCFTILGVLGGLCGPVMVWEMRCGRVYRRNRANGAVA